MKARVRTVGLIRGGVSTLRREVQVKSLPEPSISRERWESLISSIENGETLSEYTRDELSSYDNYALVRAKRLGNKKVVSELERLLGMESVEKEEKEYSLQALDTTRNPHLRWVEGSSGRTKFTVSTPSSFVPYIDIEGPTSEYAKMPGEKEVIAESMIDFDFVTRFHTTKTKFVIVNQTNSEGRGVYPTFPFPPQYKPIIYDSNLNQKEMVKEGGVDYILIVIVNNEDAKGQRDFVSDLERTKEIVEQFDPIAFSCYFDLPWEIDDDVFLPFYDGEIMKVPWSQLGHTATRLFCTGKRKDIDYSPHKYERAIFHYQQFGRMTYYKEEGWTPYHSCDHCDSCLLTYLIVQNCNRRSNGIFNESFFAPFGIIGQ